MFLLTLHNSQNVEQSKFPLVDESENCSVMFDSLQPHTVHGILHSKILEWVTIPFSGGFSKPRD